MLDEVCLAGRLWGRDSRRAAALYLALTLLFAYPLTLDPAGQVLADGPDTRLTLWILEWDTHAFLHQARAIFDANIYFPQLHTLAYSENLIGSAVLAAPVIWLTGNPVLALNLVSLLSCVLCGLGAFLLARAVGLKPSAATLAGLVFAFSPPRFLRISQLHLATIQWIPFGLAYLHRYFDHGRRADLRWALAFFTLQALTSGHGAVFILVSMAALAAYRAVRDRRMPLATWIRDAGVPGALLLLPALLVVMPYRTVQAEMGLRRSPGDWVSNWSSFFASPSHAHAFLLSLFPNGINETAQAYLFPGFLPLILTAAALLPARRQSPLGPERSSADDSRAADSRVFYAGLALVSAWLAAGPLAGLWPLVYWLPGFSFIRVPSRFMLLAVLGLAVLAGYGFERACAWMTPRSRQPIAMAAIVVLLVEFAAFPLGVTPYRMTVPAIDQWLDGQPKPFAVAELPLANPANLGGWERRHTEYMLHSTAHWQKTVEGYSGLRPPLHEELYRALVGFPDEASLQTLGELGVTYAVVHMDLYAPAQRPAIEQRLGSFQDRLTLLHEEDGGRVYRLRARPERADR